MHFVSSNSCHPWRVAFIFGLFQLCIWHQPGQTHAQKLTQTFNISGKHQNWVNRLRSVSTTSPIRTAIANNQTIERTLNQTFDIIDTLYNVIDTRRRTNNTNACNFHTGNFWSRLTRDRMFIFQIAEIERECYSSINVATAIRNGELKPSSLLSNARAVIRNGIDASFEATRKIPLPTYNEDWQVPNTPFKMIGRSQNRHAQTCTIESSFAYRVRRQWYLRVVATNRPPLSFQPDFRRHLLQEFVPRSGKHSLHMVHRRLQDDQFENCTTLVAMWGGGGVAVEVQKFDDGLSPLGQAYRNNLVRVDLASDSVTISNVAILALPMAMALVPVAFIADLNMMGMFAYTLVTDVFSTVPFLIKGIELVQSSRPNSKVFSGQYAGNDSFGALQVWTAECAGQGEFRVMGIAFMVTALSVLVMGVSMEFWAKQIMKQKDGPGKVGSSSGLLASQEGEYISNSARLNGRGEWAIASNNPVGENKQSGPRQSLVTIALEDSPFQVHNKTI